MLTIYNIGYEQRDIPVRALRSNDLQLILIPRLDLNIVITADELNGFRDGQEISPNVIDRHYGAAGGKDVIQSIKFLPGVLNGPEGQNGFAVRGGGPHQNLIRIDGVPIYEASHLGGISSIFLPSSIKNVNFYKSAFPSKFGGRLASVIDVQLEDGNRNRFDKEIGFGLEGATAHIDGPLSKNTSINVNLRSSWFGQLAKPFVKRWTDVDDLQLRYYDSYAKLSHWFSRTSKLTASAYWGDDIVKIQRNEFEGADTGLRDLNQIQWGNNFQSLNWSKLMTDRMYINLSLGRTSYNYRSRGSYDLVFTENGQLANRAFDILSQSNLLDYTANFQADYFADEDSKLSIGAELAWHENRPSITESERYAEDISEPPENLLDTAYLARNFALYGDYEWQLNEKLMLNIGLRLSSYGTEESNYGFVEPRLSMDYISGASQWRLSYTRLSQFLHLLSNPGPGLPSDLWVPSTSVIEPELSNLISLDYKESIGKNFSIGASLWYRDFDNLIEYSNPSDLIYSIIINNELYQLEVDNSNWEQRVSVGSGYAYGIEMSAEYALDKHFFQINYAYSRSFRVFDNIDGGDAFPYKFDSPHNITWQYILNLKKNNRIIINWAYSTGTAYSLSDTQRQGPDGQAILVPSSRNNFRLPHFHHLDIHYQKETKLKNASLTLDVGLYNLYNRRNAFYEYLRESGEGTSPELIKISIFPILPQFNLTYSW